MNPWTWEVIHEAIRLGAASDGVFDIAIAPTLIRWGFLPGHHEAQGREETATWRDIMLHGDGRVSFRRPLRLDLGGIAKGFAVDKAAETLIEAGVRSAVINAGGDLRFVGTRPAEIGLRNPASPIGSLIAAPLSAAAIATSAAYFANRRFLNRKVNHILHPRTRRPMRSNVSVSVLANTCVQADALTRVVLLDEPENWQALLKRERASCIFLTVRGEMVQFPAAA